MSKNANLNLRTCCSFFDFLGSTELGIGAAKLYCQISDVSLWSFNYSKCSLIITLSFFSFTVSAYYSRWLRTLIVLLKLSWFMRWERRFEQFKCLWILHTSEFNPDCCSQLGYKSRYYLNSHSLSRLAVWDNREVLDKIGWV